MFDAMDAFLRVKEKESEHSTMRTYRSQVKILKEWLLKNGFDRNGCASAFSKIVAIRFLTLSLFRNFSSNLPYRYL